MKVRLLKEFLIFFLILLISSIIIFTIVKSTNPESTNKKQLSIDIEKKLGKIIKDQIVDDNKLVINDEINDSINKLKTILEKNIKENPFEINIFVIESKTINAAALPGGTIIIYSGLIELSESPKEIAAIIAHEMGHIVNRDSMDALAKQIGISIITAAVNDSGSREIAKRAITTLLLNKYSRDRERVADNFAHKLLIKSNINPKYLASFFEKLLLLESDRSKAVYQKYIRTHPETKERIKEAEEMAELFKGSGVLLNINWQEIKKELKSLF